MTKNRRIFPSAAPEPASPLTEAPRRKRKNWRSWLTIQVESERYQPPRSGILLLQVLVGIFFFVFVTRFWYLQLHLGPEMTTQAQKNRLRTERIFAPRGRIFDDHGNILADNRTAYGLAIIREDCPDIPATLAQISQWTDTPLEQLQNRYNQDRFKTKPFEALPLVSGLDFGQVARIEADRYVRLDKFTVRSLELLDQSHILGIVELVGSLFLNFESLVVVEYTHADKAEFIFRVDFVRFHVGCYGLILVTELAVDVAFDIVQ